MESRHICTVVDLHLWVGDRYEYGSIACQPLSIADVVSKTCRLIPLNSPRQK